MAQDLREVFKDQRDKEKYPLKRDHEKRFLDRLEKELPNTKRSSFFLWKVAASLLILISVGIYVYNDYSELSTETTTVVDSDTKTRENKAISLGDLSPDLKKVENYYVANINMELSRLEISEDNKAIVDGFMEQLSDLNAEYKKLNTELNEIGPNDQTITALIKNLQLRLQLLHKLKEKLNQLKSSKNEQIQTNRI